MRIASAVRVAVASSLFLSGCAGTAKPDPKFDPAQPAAAQAATFIFSKDTKYNKELNKIAITSCNVMIAQTTTASAGTTAGTFGSNSGRVDKKIKDIYNLRGISDDQQQTLTEELCNQAEEAYRKAGFEVVPMSELVSNEHFIKMHEAGKATGFEISPGGPSKYKLYAPKGQKIFNPAYLGAGGGLKGAFQAAAGNNPVQHESRLIESLKVDAVHAEIFVDFAKVSSSNQKKVLGMTARQDYASAKGTVALTVRGKTSHVTNESMKCWTRFGKTECMAKYQGPFYGMHFPLTETEAFKAEVKDETTKGDKIAGAATMAIGMLGALAGGGGFSSKVTRNGVTVDPANFSQLTKQSYGRYLEMMTAQAKGS